MAEAGGLSARGLALLAWGTPRPQGRRPGRFDQSFSLLSPQKELGFLCGI